MKIAAIFALTAAFLTGGPALSAQAAEPKGYDVLCVRQILPGGTALPEVCVPVVV